jgi:cell wall-associated NlpC family hydrolase
VDITYYSLSQMAADMKTLDTTLTPDDKDGFATARMALMQYIGDDGTQLQNPVDEMGQNNITMTPEQIAALKAQLPANLDGVREAIVIAAYSLVGKVDYFWGGKSLAVGWDSRWGTPRKVTAGGNDSTGTFRPFGLDCSGFVGWCYVNGTKDPSIIDVIGSGSSNQWSRSAPITWAEALPGDMVFYHPPGIDNHIGLIVGDDGAGNYLVAHSPRTGEKVSITKIKKVGGSRGFQYVRRSVIFIDNQ